MEWNRMIYMALDSGAEAGNSSEPVASDNAGAIQSVPDTQVQEQQQQQVFARPKYFSQVAPAKADSEDYKALYRYQKLDELADAAIALQKENDTLRSNSKRSIVVPDGKNPEEVQEFARKLGIPDTADGYTLKGLDKELVPEDSLKIIKDRCHKAMMTDRQANAVSKIILDLTQSGLQMQKQAFEERRDRFNDSLKASYTDIEADVDRESAANRDLGAYKAFAEESGLKELLEDNGLAYDSSFVKGVAAYARKHTGQVQVQTVPDKRDNNNTRNTVYGKSFLDRYGRK